MSDGHEWVDSDGFFDGYFEGPGIFITDVSFSGGGMDIDTEAAEARFSLEERDVDEGFSIFEGCSEVELVRHEDDTVFGDMDSLCGVLGFSIEDGVLIDQEGRCEVDVVAIGSKAMGLEGADNNGIFFNLV